MNIKSDSRGMTLLELVIAISLLGVVLTGAYFFFASSTNTFKDVEAQYIAKEEARTAAISMEDDIRKAQAVNLSGIIHKAAEVKALGMQLDVYTDADSDGTPELVQYKVEDNKLKRGTAELGSVPAKWSVMAGKVRNNMLSPVVPIFTVDDGAVKINLIITDAKERLTDNPVSICTTVTVRSKGAMD